MSETSKLSDGELIDMERTFWRIKQEAARAERDYWLEKNKRENVGR